MAPSQEKEKHSLTTDQTKLLCEVITKANVTLMPAQWNEIAASLGISNGKAAKERYRYMMNCLSGLPTRAAKNDDSSKDPSTSKSAVKKAKAPSTPASTKDKATKQSAKKRKLDDDEGEDSVTKEKNHDVATSDAEDEVTSTKTPKPKRPKNLATPFQTPKKVKAKPEENVAVDGAEEVDSDSTKVDSSVYSSTTAAETPDPKPEPRNLETLFEEEGFGVIGGGEVSMFPDGEDEI